jgi:hypothetical protein
VIRTTIRHQRGRGHEAQCSTDARRAVAPTILDVAALQRLRSPRSRSVGTVRHSMGRRRVVGRVARASAVLGMRSAHLVFSFSIASTSTAISFSYRSASCGFATIRSASSMQMHWRMRRRPSPLA